MRRVCGVACAMALLVAACGGSGSTDPSAAQTCRQLIDVEFNIINSMIGQMSGWSEERVQDLIDTGDFPSELSRYEDLLDEYNDRVDELDCDYDQMGEWECDGLGRISTGNTAGRMIRANLAEFCE